jgi:hypothetical protein
MNFDEKWIVVCEDVFFFRVKMVPSKNHVMHLNEHTVLQNS